ncbi:MAG TPA: SDR family oxidoreductase [Acidimicrobiales bacterium]|nr:SDR family oxidoreductase [Acidimicrobiales bacterium]
MGVALVTGCSSGVGLETALELARRGHTVFAGVRRPDAASELRDAIAAESLLVTPVPLDVCEQASVDAAVARVQAEAGPVDVLVNNAGIAQFAAVEDQPVEEAERMVATNLVGPLRLIKAVVPAMRERRGGTIVNVSSVSGFVSVPFLGVYSATKFGLEALSEALAHEVQGAGIRVLVVDLGVFDTRIDEKSPAPPPSVALDGRAEAARVSRLEMAANAPPVSFAAISICDAIDDPSSPRRVLVGEDAVMMRDLHDQQSESALYDTLHAFYDLP